MPTSSREARLRPEYAHLYPALEAGAWEPAVVLGRRLLVWSLIQPKPVRFGPRLLRDSHFEFRGRAADGSADPQAPGVAQLRRRGDRVAHRECRLRPEFASHYPHMPAGEWLSADHAIALLLEQRGIDSVEELGERPLAPEHFEFRGGARRGERAALRTRAEDPEPKSA
jgi:hypothetical protein